VAPPQRADGLLSLIGGPHCTILTVALWRQSTAFRRATADGDRRLRARESTKILEDKRLALWQKPLMNELGHLARTSVIDLAAGERHYRAFVGPPYRFDLISTNQFSLLTLLGMRETHRLLDFGCGSLRLGRLAIPYLLPGLYYGVEPEAWLVEDGFAHELGQDARTLKAPVFSHNADYRTDQFGVHFDFIMAQSIFSHTGESTTRAALASFKHSLAPGGLIVANWLLGAEGPPFDAATSDWVYPECVPFAPERIARLAHEAELCIRHCPWPHPGGLTYYLLAHRWEDLPGEADLAPLALAPLARPTPAG
jgi:SAM-dependent methyltransferase